MVHLLEKSRVRAAVSIRLEHARRMMQIIPGGSRTRVPTCVQARLFHADGSTTELQG